MMAPEMARGVCTTVKSAQKADIFSLGITIYETSKGSDAPFMAPRLKYYVPFLDYPQIIKHLGGLTYEEIKRWHFIPQTSLDFLIWNMINPQEPENRPDVDTVIPCLKEILLKEFGLTEKQLTPT